MTPTGRRRRIWSEFLPPEELGSAATRSLLHRFGLEVLVALPPAFETGPMAEAVHRLSRSGISVGLWPLLDDQDGYWPSEGNSRAFVRRVDEALAFARAAGANVRTLAIDLEPPLIVTRRLFDGQVSTAASHIASELRSLGSSERRARFRATVCIFQDLARRLAALDIESFAAVIPPVVLDLRSRSSVWQAVFQTPCWSIAWGKVSPLTYTSVLRRHTPWTSRSLARGVLYDVARTLTARLGRGAALSLGCVGYGKLGDEPMLDFARELADDVRAAQAGGVDDLALFALDGVLSSEAPEEWLRAFTEADPTPAVFRSSKVISLATAIAAAGTRGLGFWARDLESASPFRGSTDG